jgi:DNA invertase Pin-like site-specific DNA recombinase
MSFNLNPNKIYVYLRVSTRTQATKTNGIDDQNKICNEFINNYFKNTPVEYYTDIGSSYNNKSNLPNLNKIIKKINSSENSLLLIRDVSRLGRNSFKVFCLLNKIKKTNSHIIAVSENVCYNYTRLMDRKFSHLIIDSEESSDLKSLKSLKRHQTIKKLGGYIGNAPYGTIVIKQNGYPKIFKNPQEIDIIKQIRELLIKFKNITKTTIYLNRNKILGRKNSEWNDTKIKYIMNKFFPKIISNPNEDLIEKKLSIYPNYDEEEEIYFKEISDIEKLKLD